MTKTYNVILTLGTGPKGQEGFSSAEGSCVIELPENYDQLGERAQRTERYNRIHAAFLEKLRSQHPELLEGVTYTALFDYVEVVLEN